MNMTKTAILSMGMSICLFVCRLKPAWAQDQGTAPLTAAASQLMVGAPTNYQNLTIYPITLAELTDPSRYISQDKAKANIATILQTFDRFSHWSFILRPRP